MMSEYKYHLTLRPFGIGSYPKNDNFLRFEKDETKFGVLVYSKRIDSEKIDHYSLSPITEIEQIDGKKVNVSKTSDYWHLKAVKNPQGYYFIEATQYDDDEVIDKATITTADVIRNIEIGRWILVDENDSDLSKAIEIETEHKQTLEDVASGKLTPDEAIIETVKDHLEESPDYYDSEKGLPAMEERLKEDDNIPTETYGSLQLQINDLHKEISKRSDLIRQGQLDRFGILQKEFDDLSNERNILIRKQDNLLKLKSKPAMEERLKSESELNKNDRVMTTDEVEISASEVKPWDYIKIELSKDDFKHVVVRKIEDRGDYVLFFNETRSDNDIKIRKTRKVILVERGRKPIENGVFIEEFDYPNGKVDYVADVYYNGYEKRTSHHLDKKHTQVEGDMIYQELIKKYNESESKQLPEYALLFNDRLVKRYGEDSTQADKDNLRSQYIRELDRGYLKSLVQKGDISQQWADRVLESAELKTNTVPPVDDRLKKEMLKDICLNADKEKKTLILDVLEEDVELYKSFGFKIIG